MQAAQGGMREQSSYQLRVTPSPSPPNKPSAQIPPAAAAAADDEVVYVHEPGKKATSLVLVKKERLKELEIYSAELLMYSKLIHFLVRPLTEEELMWKHINIGDRVFMAAASQPLGVQKWYQSSGGGRGSKSSSGSLDIFPRTQQIQFPFTEFVL